MWQRFFWALNEWKTSQKSSYLTVLTCSTFAVQLFFLLWSPVCFCSHVSDLTTPSGVSFRVAWLVTLPLPRFFNEWGGQGHPSAASSLHIHDLLLAILQADALYNSIPASPKLCNTEIQFRMNWLFWRVWWMVQMGTHLPAYELLLKHFLRELWKFVSWVCYKVHCQTVWVLGLDWISLKLEMNFQCE